MARKKEKEGPRNWPIIISAIGLGLVAALFASLYLKSREASLRELLAGAEVEEVNVVVARVELAKGAAVSPDSFAVRPLPLEYVHDDAVYPEEFESYQGRAITASLGAGKTLLKSFLDEEFPVDFSDLITEGRRAITVTVDEVNSVAGHIRPGNRVDLYVNIPFRESGFNPLAAAAGIAGAVPASIQAKIPPDLLNQGEEIAAQVIALAAPGDVILPVLQDVLVLATGKEPYDETLDELRQPQYRYEESYSSLTVDVSPRQAALLTAAQDKGELLGILRNRKDRGSADFSTVSSRDLFDNADAMAQAEAARRSRVSAVAGVDGNGDLVDADGNKIMSRAELEAAGFTVNENGEIVDADGNVVDPADLVVTADGKILSREQLAAAGLSVNASGQIVDASGNVVSADDVIVTADGTVVTRQQLEASGLSVDAEGRIVDADGRVVDASELVTTADGRVLTKAQLAEAGLSINAQGQIVDADGNVVDPDDVVIAADGTVTTKAELAAAGLSVNERGEIVGKDGKPVSIADLRDSLGRPPSAAALADKAARAATGPGEVELIVGGASEEGVAKVKKLPINE